MRVTDDYLDLITPFFRGKPRFEATVALVTDILAEAQKFVGDNLPSCFDLDTAIGVQLDKTGEWIGRDRFLHTPITDAYFSFDIPPLGFDLAVWAGPYSPTDQITALDDTTYRCLLYAKIEANNSDGTTATIQRIYSDFLACNNVIPGTNVYIEDRQDMSMIVGLAGKMPPLLYLELMTTEFVPLKPEGVRLYFAETTVDLASIFGFDISNEFIQGFDQGSWASVTQV